GCDFSSVAWPTNSWKRKTNPQPLRKPRRSGHPEIQNRFKGCATRPAVGAVHGDALHDLSNAILLSYFTYELFGYFGVWVFPAPPPLKVECDFDSQGQRSWFAIENRGLILPLRNSLQRG